MMILFQFYIYIFIYKLYYLKYISTKLRINNYRISFNNVIVVLALSIFVKLNIESVNIHN